MLYADFAGQLSVWKGPESSFARQIFRRPWYDK